MNNQTRNGVIALSAGVIAFFTRYVPIVLQERLFLEDQRVSIELAARTCKTTLGSYADYCSWASGVDVFLILLAATLIVLGAYLLKTHK